MKDRGNLLDAKRLEILKETGLLRSPTPEGLDLICEKAQEHFQVETVLVSLVDRSRQIVKAGTVRGIHATPRSLSFCHHTIQSDEVMVVPDAQHDSRFTLNPFVVGNPHIRFYAGAPLIYLPDVRLGALCLIDSEPRDLPQPEQDDLAVMAHEVVQLIADWEFEGWFK